MSDPARQLEQIESPCIGVCRLGEDDLCVGCFRSRREIAEWLAYSPGQRREIMDRLPARAEGRFAEE